MRKLSFSLVGIFALVAVLTSCNRSSQYDGQLIGVQDRPSWNGINPYGMVYVPSGTLHIGQSDQDIFNSYSQRPMAVSIPGFYMDDSEITNNEYRQFVHWVRDSIAHTLLENFQFTGGDEEKIDWTYPIYWDDELLDEMYLEADETVSGRRAINTGLLNFEYRWIDWQRAAHDRDATVEQLINSETVNIYPDTLVWIRDLGYSYNEPMTRNYFWHPAFDDYPIVGVTWKQAKAFCAWRTMLWNGHLIDQPNTEDFRLPTEFEWEYAARGGRTSAMYPWGSYYLRNAKGCLLANFKPQRGNYAEDGGLYTVGVYEYYPNDYGLYQMAGNVAEWTESDYHEAAFSFIHDLSPDMKYDAKPDDPEAWKRKVVRGGSWKDVSYYLQNSTRHWEYQDTAKSYIGFRCALTFLGRSINDY